MRTAASKLLRLPQMQVERRTVDVEVGECRLPVDIGVPEEAKGIVIDLQASELERLVPQDTALLEQLCACGFAFLAAGLLTAEEAGSQELATTRRFDIEVLANRATKVVDWIRAQHSTVPIGVVARGTAAAAALAVASRRQLAAIVSVAGRPDLAASVLPLVDTPTLFLVGADNVPSLHFSQLGADRMYCARDLRVIPGADLLDQPAEAAAAAIWAQRWFEQYLLLSPRRGNSSEATMPVASAG